MRVTGRGRGRLHARYRSFYVQPNSHKHTLVALISSVANATDALSEKRSLVEPGPTNSSSTLGLAHSTLARELDLR